MPDQPVYTVTLNPGLDRTLTVPEIRYNEVLRASESRLDWGGKGFNVSRGLMALGVRSVAMGFVGGATGAMLEQGLHDLGIATDFVSIEGETRTNTVFVEDGSDRYLKVNEAGPMIGAQSLEALYAQVANTTAPGSLWTLCGSLPPGVPVNVYVRLVDVIQDNGGLAFLDASGDALAEGCTAQPYLVKPNAEEAAAMTGMRVESAEDASIAAERFLDAGARTVALSLGADGLVYASEDGTVHARPPRVDVQTVVGVGDALLAGIVYGVREGLDPAETARLGVAAGTAAAMGRGVSVGSMKTVEALVACVHVREFS